MFEEVPPPALVEYDDLKPSMGKVIGRGGQSRSVTEIDRGGRWLAKLYTDDGDSERIDRLISFPRQPQLNSKDRELILRCTSWPVSRVIDGDRTVGTLIPSAPDSFSTLLAAPSGRRVSKMLTLDWLSISDARLAMRGVRVPSWQNRLAVARQLAEVASLFERHGLVYGDWNYGNAFWSPNGNAVYVIDIDSCSFGTQRDRHAIDWEDPASDGIADTLTDRFRVALMTIRCLTGKHDLSSAIETLDTVALSTAATALVEVCSLMLSASNREQRPSATVLREVIAAAEVNAEHDFHDVPVGAFIYPRYPSTDDGTSPGHSLRDWPDVSNWRASAWSTRDRKSKQ